MIKRRTIGVTVATALLGGLGAYGATAAFAASPSLAPQPTATSTDSPGGADGMDRDEMIRHCTDHLPADERAKARQQMEKMMSGGMDKMMSGGMNGMMSGSMTGGMSGDGHHGMG
ncbi:hypothetical protein [Streptomyces gobiensis]|uniref:hypothetical protein n=1 Tax=Streptomyces gobiensis TaxID=2875706 RepID=UPI001E35F424|nr:hypothetical protein [Streptomyces gobiensis]UGY91279.1 hypothetical protein test1122_05800 [Streptomyces gobiensis]